MTKETHFEHPPRGFIGVLAYDPGNDRYRIVQVASDTNPNLLVQIQKDGLAPQVGNVAGDDVGTGTNVLFCAGLVYGFDGTAWDRLRCTDQKLDTALHGWDGAAERKLNLLWGYYDNYLEEVSDTNVTAATHQLDGTTVPEGEVWVVTALSGYASTANPTNVQFGISRSGTRYFIYSTPVAAAYTIYPINGSWVMKEGDNGFVRFQACGAGDDIFGYLIGYKMQVDQ